MKIADLYIRVSTDEQADKGYSQRDQEERLRKYCDINQIQIRNVIFEDHSAKTFKRPEWAKLLAELKKRRGKSDLVLFTKWDRFSRNAGDAYQMISTLRDLGVEPQGIEQPLDLAIPENKMMLAFYLAAPEVENDRRALNVFNGMRRAKKEGRYMGCVPLGYTNKVTEDGRKYIGIVKSEASLIKWAFKEIGKGILAADQVRKLVNEKGLKCSRANFWTLIRNPIFCGKIFVPKHKDEEACFVQGTHEPIISERLFFDVQDILDGKKRVERINTKSLTPELLPLRGFLSCPICGRSITGSGSKGQYSVFYYYHCLSPCKWRYRADFVNKEFKDELEKYVPSTGIETLSKAVLKNAYKNRIGSSHDSRKQLVLEIGKVNQRLAKARDLLLSEEIEPSDYREIKEQATKNLNRLEAKLSDQTSPQSSISNIDNVLDKIYYNLSNLSQNYTDSTVLRKRNIISSIFPEKFSFDENGYRTPKVNEAAMLIYNINKELEQKKNKKNDALNHASCIVDNTILKQYKWYFIY